MAIRRFFIGPAIASIFVIGIRLLGSVPQVMAETSTEAFSVAADRAGTPAQVGTTLPPHFPVIENYYLGVPVIGFGSHRGRVNHVPIIFLHGNNDTPFPTACNPFGKSKALRSISWTTATAPGNCGGWGIRVISATYWNTDQALRRRPQHSRCRAGAAPVRARGAQIYRRPTRGHRRTQPGRNSCARMDVAG